MRNNYPECYKAVRQFEGGNDDDPHDPGGRTSRGIIQREWDVFKKTHPGRPADVWKASEADIGTIYHDGEYWAGQRLDDMYSGNDETMFDYGVNSGPGRSQKVLRRCLHLPDKASTADVNSKMSRLTNDQLKTLIVAINDERLQFLRSLPTWPRFGGGWGKRVVQTKAISLHLFDSPVGANQVPSIPPSVVPAATASEVSLMTAKGNHAEPTSAKNAVKAGIGGGAPVAGATFFDWCYSHPIETAVIASCCVVLLFVTIRAISAWHKNRQEAPPVGWSPPLELKAA